MKKFSELKSFVKNARYAFYDFNDRLEFRYGDSFAGITAQNALQGLLIGNAVGVGATVLGIAPANFAIPYCAGAGLVLGSLAWPGHLICEKFEDWLNR